MFKAKKENEKLKFENSTLSAKNAMLENEIAELKKFIKSKDLSSLPSLEEEKKKFQLYQNATKKMADYYLKFLDEEVKREMDLVDSLSGFKFEEYCKELLLHHNFYDISVTSSSGDNGIDLICSNDGASYGIQCKNYSKNVSNKAVQEVFSGIKFYSLDKGIVLTNSYFTKSANEAASKFDVILWDRDDLNKLIRQYFIRKKIALNELSKLSINDFSEVKSVNIEIPIDELYEEAKDLVIEMQAASISLLQRRFRIGYNRAARLIDELEENQVISRSNGSKPRTILKK